MSMTTNPGHTLIYNGSVKQIFQDARSPETLLFAFTDDYSVFDWGKMPDTLANKGRSLVLMGGYFFDQLAQPPMWQALPDTVNRRFSGAWLDALWTSQSYQTLRQHGIQHHAKGWVNSEGQPLSLQDIARQPNASAYLAVQAVQVTSPEEQAEGTFNYQPTHQAHQAEPQRFHLVPLEVVFRLGIPKGSSYLDRNPAIQPNTWLHEPVVEFFTKLEPHDRWLSSTDAQAVSGLTEQKLSELSTLTTLLALWLFQFFEQRGIELWDGKFEFAYCPATGAFMLVDSIGPDELRLMVGDVPLSKECLRQFYRTTPWYREWSQAKAAGNHDHSAVSQPPALPPKFKNMMNHVYPCLLNTCVGQPVIPETPDLAELVALLGKPTPFAV